MPLRFEKSVWGRVAIFADRKASPVFSGFTGIRVGYYESYEWAMREVLVAARQNVDTSEAMIPDSHPWNACQ